MIAVCMSLPVSAEDYVCGFDINGNGNLTEENEVAFCDQTTLGGHSCPLRRAECILQPAEPETEAETGSDDRCSLVDTGSVFVGVCHTTGETNASFSEAATMSTCLDTCPTSTAGETEERWINPLTDTVCTENIGTDTAPIFVASTLDCQLKTEIHTPTADQDLPADTDTSSEDCTNLRIFTGAGKQCRNGGFQTRWDNCCNNGEKVIEDSFSEQTTEERIEGMGAMVGDMVNTITGSTYGSEMHQLISEVFVTVPAEMDGLRIAGIVGNWISTPCADDSENVLMMASGLCHYIGRKCIEEWALVGCVQQAEVHCCYKTKLARLFNEQAKEQLIGAGWGTVDEPNCEGFTPEQFQSIDFSKLDFSDYFEDIKHKSAEDMQTDMQNKFDSMEFSR